jgi:hypothetical protein
VPPYFSEVNRKPLRNPDTSPKYEASKIRYYEWSH